jgi:MFS family permease
VSFVQRNSIFSLLFLFGLILVNGIGVTLPIPNLILIGDFYNFPLIGVVEAIFIIISTLFLIIWGYVVDQYDRKVILLGANLLWLLPSIIIFLFPEELIVYIICRLGMAIGLAAFSPLAYSVIADFAYYDDRGTISSGLNLAWVGSSAAGIVLGALFTEDWHLSFGVLALFGFFLFFYQFYLKVPERGASEPAFSGVDEFEYHWKLTIEDLNIIKRTKSLRWLLIQGSFALIPGTVFTYWLVSFLSSEEGLSVSIGMASIIAISIASGRAPGYVLFGILGDKMSLKNSDSTVRAKIAAVGMICQGFLFLVAFLALGSSFQSRVVFGILFWLGSFVGAASGPNRTAILFNISLPETRGTIGAFYSLTDHLGAAFGLFISTMVLQVMDYNFVFSGSLIFYVLASLSWYRSISYIKTDQKRIDGVLDDRAQDLSSDKMS